jgi:hypothetical protein
MILYHPDFPKISLIPLFPESTSIPVDLSLEIANEISLDEQGLPEEAFFEMLTRANYWWSGYVLMDQFAMISIIDSLGGIDLGDGTHNGALTIGNLPIASVDPGAAVTAQSTLLSKICALILTHDAAIAVEDVLSLFPRHIRSDRTSLDLKSIWQTIITAEQQFSCSFPTIDSSVP